MPGYEYDWTDQLFTTLLLSIIAAAVCVVLAPAVCRVLKWLFPDPKPPAVPARPRRRWQIPESNIVQVLELHDECQPSFCCDENLLVSRYWFWSKLYELLPEIRGVPVRLNRLNHPPFVEVVEILFGEPGSEQGASYGAP